MKTSAPLINSGPHERTALRDAIQAEWTKLRTTPGTGWLVLAVIATTVAVSASAAATTGCPAGLCRVDPAKLSLTGVQVGQTVVAILAVLMIGGEYGTGMVHVTFAAMPRRITVLAAKAAVLLGVVIPTATVAVLASILTGRLVLPGHVPAPSLGDGPVLRAAGGSILYLALIALLSLGIATIVRSSATAIGLVLGLLFLFPLLAQAAPDPDWQRHLEQLGPMTAGLAIQATVGLDDLPIGPWAGLGVLACWAGAALLVGGLLLHRRDA